MLTRLSIIIALFLIVAFGLSGPVYSSFHSGGVGSCSGCHSEHSSEDGVPLGIGSGSFLLLASDPSSLCLTCHAGAGSSSSPSVFSFDGSALTPGGDFYWLTKSFSWSGGSSPAARHGHNVVARDFGLSEDPNKVNSPGGNYPSSQLSCISCHDPHARSQGGTRSGRSPVAGSGSYGEIAEAGTTRGTYRLLGGLNYSVNGFSFNYPAPVARQNKVLPFAEKVVSHVDYGSGMSEWCANCHATALSGDHLIGGSQFTHPVGSDKAITPNVVAVYNSYLRSGDLTGNITTAYLPFVPFERGTSSPTLLDPTSTQGPSSNANISCLSCHRAHASAFRSIGRWDFSVQLLIDSHPAVGDTGVVGDDVSNSYYGRDIVSEFGVGQRQFCEKCHAGQIL